MTLAEVLREEGFEKGIKKGLEKGIEEGIEKGIEKGETRAYSKIAIKALSKKMGILPAVYRERIAQLDLITLEILNEEIDDFKSIEDVKKFLGL